MTNQLFYDLRDFTDETFPFKIEFRNQDELNVREHAHNFFQINYVSKGCIIHSVNNNQDTVNKGEIFAVPPYLEHRLVAIPGAEVELYQIDFMPYLINENMRDISQFDGFFDFAYIQPIISINDRLMQKLHLSSSSRIEIEQLVKEMLQEFTERREGWRIAIKADVLKMLVIVGREYHSFLEGRQEKQMIQIHRRAFHETLEYLKEHFHEELSLEALADRAAMAPTYFSYIFKMITGKNYIEYLNELRIQHAMTLLKTTDLSVTEISMSSGFNHLSHFNRMFKKYVGLTPSSYRKS